MSETRPLRGGPQSIPRIAENRTCRGFKRVPWAGKPRFPAHGMWDWARVVAVSCVAGLAPATSHGFEYSVGLTLVLTNLIYAHPR